MIIGINGKIGHGKDSLGQIIQESFPEMNFEIKKFAGKLKQAASLFLNIPVEDLEKQEVKERELGREWNQLFLGVDLNFDLEENPEPEIQKAYKPLTIREFLQKLGTEDCRNQIHQDFWVNCLFSEYTPDKNWIITDLRFPNEYNRIKELGGIVVKIERPNFPITNHISETSLDNHIFDHTFINSGNLIDLQTQFFISELSNLIYGKELELRYKL